MYKVFYLQGVEADLEALDKPVRKRIMDKIEETLAQDPYGLGKKLSGEFSGFWRYRIGDYRIIYKISESDILILVARVGHRRHIYKRKIKF